MIACINAVHNNVKANKLPADDMSGLEAKVHLSINCRIMLTRNLWTEMSLCDGAMVMCMILFINQECFLQHYQ